MKIIYLILTIAILSIGMFGQSSKESLAIRKVMDDQAAAWNRGDIDAFMSIGYWRSEKLNFISGDKITRGWQPTLENYKRSYPSKEAMGLLTFSDLDITVLSGDAAYVIGSWRLEREKDTPRGKFTLLFRKFKEGWRIVSDHTS